MLVAIDSNLVDLFNSACATTAHVDAMEAVEPPPSFEGMTTDLEVEAFACYWILAIAPAWRSTIYTFSDKLYDEVSRAPTASALLRVAFDVLVREEQIVERIVCPTRFDVRPTRR